MIHSDTHINSTVGLCYPGYELDDGNAVQLSKFQRFLWTSWNETLDKIDKIRQGELITAFNGDLCEGDIHKRSGQIITRNKADIVGMTTKVIEPVCQSSDKVYFGKGTPAHSGGNAELETLVAKNFDNTVKDKDTGSSTWWHLPLQLEKVRFDIMHHPRSNGGGRPMNSQGAVDRLAADTLFMYANNGDTPPDFVIRSHIHHHLDSHDAFRTRAIITPAWSLLTEYGYRIGLSMQADFGCIVIIVDGDQAQVIPLLHKMKGKKWQTIM